MLSRAQSPAVGISMRPRYSLTEAYSKSVVERTTSHVSGPELLKRLFTGYKSCHVIVLLSNRMPDFTCARDLVPEFLGNLLMD